MVLVQKFFTVVLIVVVLGVLLRINATLLGWAFVLVDVPTVLYSNHTIGAGIGFGFMQSNPPGPVPVAVGNAYNLYSAWSYGRTDEPLPELRQNILDRTNLSSIGEFSVRAVKARSKINCSGVPIEITTDLIDADPDNPQYNGYSYNIYYNVSTNIGSDVQLRPQKQLTLWVDQYENITASKAVTRLFFAALGGNIEGGHHNELPSGLPDLCGEYCSSISSLACDVEIDLVDSQACTGQCSEINATLSSMETLQMGDLPPFSPPPRYIWPISVYLAAASTVFGSAVYGRQPLFAPGIKDLSSPYALPQSYSDWAVRPLVLV